MIISVNPMGAAELDRLRDQPDAGLGALRTDRGNLPLDRLDVQARISGLVVRTELTTEFVNAHDTALEATYVFPLPDRAAVTGMSMTAAERTVVARLRERAEAREEYDAAVAAGQRASIAEEERPDVFTMRVGNIMPGERVVVRLRLVGPLAYEDDAATFRFPLVVAPRYVPGAPLPGPWVSDGQHPDTDAVPDASRISPPVLLPGFPNPLRLSIGVEIDPSGLDLGEVRSSLHTVTEQDGDGGARAASDGGDRRATRLRIAPGERADRDFVLRLAYAPGSETAVAVPDEDGDQGTYQLVVLPPEPATAPRPKDVVLLLDRSGSMGGWKMVAARRAAARVIDTLTAADRFTVLTFDHQVERPDGLAEGLVEATDRHRYRAVEHLARADARGGTELLAPLRAGLALLSDSTGRDRVLVLVTDGQVGNEDQIVREVTPLIGATRVHTVGIDRAVNAGFLGRLAALGAGRSELVESEDRLDEAMEHIHRRIGAPVVTGLAITGDGIELLGETRSPARLPGLYPGVPLVVTGRYTGAAGGTLTVTGRTRDEQRFHTAVAVQERSEQAVTSLWARARLRDAEDAYAAGAHALEQEIVQTSLRFGVLCRFTAFVAVDERVVNEGGPTKQVTQPVEMPSGWEPPPLPASAPPQMFLGAVAASPFAGPPAAPMAPGSPMPPRPPSPSFRARAGGPGMAGSAGKRGSSVARSGRAPFLGPNGPGASPAAESIIPPAAPDASGMLFDEAAAPPETAEFQNLLTVELGRLHDAAGLPAADRRDLLDDLASRLAVLIEGLSDRQSEMVLALRKLIDELRGSATLDEKWAAALDRIGRFATDQAPGDSGRTTGVGPVTEGSETSTTSDDAASTAAEPSPPPGKKTRSVPFWKR